MISVDLSAVSSFGTRRCLRDEHPWGQSNLSYNLVGGPRKDREYFTMGFEGGVFFIRDKRFRLHENGRFYDVSVASNTTRYNVNVLDNPPQQAGVRQQFQHRLGQFMQIKQTDRSYKNVPFGTGGDNFRNAQDKARNPKSKQNGM